MSLSTALLIAYGVVALVVWRIVAGHIAYMDGDKPEGIDYIAGFYFGGVLAALWPVAAVAIFAFRAFPLKSRNERLAEASVLSQELKEREARVRGLERDLGIK